MADSEAQQEEMGFMDHLEELRRRLFFALLGILSAAIVLFVAKDWVFNRLIFAPRNPDFITFRAWCSLGHLTGAGDRLCVSEIGYELINTTMLGNFSAHILVSAIGGFIVAFPLTFSQIWRFIRPGLHGHESRAVRGVTWAASFLFFLGICFGYFVIAPVSLQFLGHYDIGDVQMRIALMSYLKTVASITLAAGLIFPGARRHPLLGQNGPGDPRRPAKIPTPYPGGHVDHRRHHHPARPHFSSSGGHAGIGPLRNRHPASQANPTQGTHPI